MAGRGHNAVSCSELPFSFVSLFIRFMVMIVYKNIATKKWKMVELPLLRS